MKDFNINDSFDEIAEYKESTFKRKVHTAAQKLNFDQLKGNIKSKGSQLNYEKFETQKYLLGIFNEKDAKFLFKIRSNMLKVKLNFKNNFDESSLQCEQCNDGALDTQRHITVCSGLQHKNIIHVEDLLSSNLMKVKSTLLNIN